MGVRGSGIAITDGGSGLQAHDSRGFGQRSSGSSGALADGVVALDGRCKGIGGSGARAIGRRSLGGTAGEEFMSDGFIGLEPAIGIPSKATRDEVQECFVFAFQGLLQRLAAGPPPFAFGADGDSGLAQGVEEELFARALLDEVLFWRTKDLHYASQLLLLVLTWEDRVASEELGENATQ